MTGLLEWGGRKTCLDSCLLIVLALIVHHFVFHVSSDSNPDPRLKDDVQSGDNKPVSADEQAIPEEIVPAEAPAATRRKRFKRPAAAMKCSAAVADDEPRDGPGDAMKSSAAVADDGPGDACDDTKQVVEEKGSEGPQDGSSSTSNTSSVSSPSTSSKRDMGEMQEEEFPISIDKVVENLFDLSSFEADNGGIAAAEKKLNTSEIASLADVFGCADRYVDRLQNYFGMEKIEQLIKNISGCNVLTFYSGLGGAELSIMQLYYSLCRWAEVHDRTPPLKPRFVVACDIDASCQRVLLSHKDI